MSVLFPSFSSNELYWNNDTFMYYENFMSLNWISKVTSFYLKRLNCLFIVAVFYKFFVRNIRSISTTDRKVILFELPSLDQTTKSCQWEKHWKWTYKAVSATHKNWLCALLIVHIKTKTNQKLKTVKFTLLITWNFCYVCYQNGLRFFGYF